MKITTVMIAVWLCTVQVLVAQTPGRKAILGTKCSVELRKGFDLSKRFNGVEHGSGKAVLMFSVLPSSVESNKSSYTPLELKKRGMTLVEKTEPVVGGVPATLYEVTLNNKGTLYRKLMLFFGDSLKTVFINTMAPDSSESLKNDVRAILMSVQYHADTAEDYLSAVEFTLDFNAAGLKAAKFSKAGVMYTMDGYAPTLHADKVLFNAGSAIRKDSREDRKEFTLKRIKSVPGLDSLMAVTTDSIRIDNLPGYEINAMARMKNRTTELIYAVILFDGDEKYFAMMGNAAGHTEEYLSRFRKLSRTFKRK